ncbi:MAG: response regulator [Syntrophorhabdaceae bacterium]|nr:response regulator [Syntrophorhabdales bacterium]MBP9560183.1 response regulator [Syntrophorhabdaceae bacterium]
MEEPIRILVVDDEKGIREGCRRILAGEGHAVDVAENGKVGLDKVKTNHYDLLVVDLMMPVMGGIDMMGHVKEIDPDIIMIVITGFATIETAVDAIKHGAYDYIPKPFTPDNLIAVINRGIETRRLRLQTRRLMEERDQRLLELANEKSKMHAIINSMADGVLVINKESQLALWNPAAIKMLNLHEQPESGKNLSEVVQNEDLIRVIRKACSPEASSYTSITEEIELPPPESKTLMVNVSIIRDDESGQDLGLVATLRDITRLKELDKLKSQFVAMVTHELRAPVSAIEGYLTAFLTGAAGSDPKMYIQMMERARQRARSLLELINDLLQFSKLEAKSAVRKKELLDISGIIINTVELLKGQGESKDLTFEIDVPDTLPLIEADRAEMEQLFTNLISNAIKYNVKNGKVKVSAKANKHFLNITVADTGIGIEADCLPHIFDEFYRVSCPETRYTTGTGLGLSIVKKIVESHFGRIDVESIPGKGTTFTVSLPIKQKK